LDSLLYNTYKQLCQNKYPSDDVIIMYQLQRDGRIFFFSSTTASSETGIPH